VGHILIPWKELILMFGILDNGQNVGIITTKLKKKKGGRILPT